MVMPVSPTTSNKKSHVSLVERLFLIFLGTFGALMIVLIPPGAGYDEEDHLVRVWELSKFSFLPGEMSPQEMQYPLVFRDFAYRQQGSTGVIEAGFWQKYTRASLYQDGIVRREIDTKSVYSPALLLPQALAMRFLARSADTPALFLFYACRFAGLLSYLLLAWMAIRLLPFGKWILMVLVLAPMSLFQAATVSPDAISNGIGFLFIAGSLRIAEQKTIARKEVAALISLVLLLFLAKLNLLPLVLLPFLLMPPSRFTGKLSYLALLASTVILFTIEIAGWNLIAAGRSNPLLANGADPGAQLIYILNHPLSFLLTIFRDIFTNGWTYLEGWINGYGYYFWTPPALVSLLFVLSLGAALLTDSSPGRLLKKYWPAFAIVLVAGYLASIAPGYLTFTPVGSIQILGVQGRYFIPLALLLFLALAGIPWRSKKPELSYGWTWGFLATALSLNLIAIYLSFHVPCGATFYTIDLCYRPLFRDFPSEIQPVAVTAGISLEQEVGVTCDGFTEVRVWLLPPASGGEGTTRFILRDVTADEVVREASLTNSTIATENWYPLHFEPIGESAGKQFRLDIQGTAASDNQSPRILFTTQPEFDAGNLSENGQARQEDVVLQHGCETGLRKLGLSGKP